MLQYFTHSFIRLNKALSYGVVNGEGGREEIDKARLLVGLDVVGGSDGPSAMLACRRRERHKTTEDER